MELGEPENRDQRGAHVSVVYVTQQVLSFFFKTRTACGFNHQQNKKTCLSGRIVRHDAPEELQVKGFLCNWMESARHKNLFFFTKCCPGIWKRGSLPLQVR
jgi:hypothetical protein